MIKHHDAIAAVIMEPLVQGAGGMIVHPEGYLEGVRELCTGYDVLLIADEVATGFGRTGKMFACEHENVMPDLMCVAKGITGGYLPLAATLATNVVYEAFLGQYAEMKTFFHGHTFSGNALACAAALASLDIFENENVLEKLQPKIELLTRSLAGLAPLTHVGDIRQRGFMVGIELVKDKGTREAYAWEEQIGAQVIQEARKRGVILRPLGNVIVLMPPLCISEQTLHEMMDVVEESIKKVTE